MSNGKIETYEEAARSISIWLKEFCDYDLQYPEMIADASRKAAAKIYSMRWIDVEEELPEIDQKVLCVQNPNTTATRKTLYAVFDGSRFIPELGLSIFANYEIGKTQWSDITFWMPLPEIPYDI